MRTAFIGAYGYGNLGDELCLIEAMQEFPPGEPPSGGAFAFTQNPAWTNRCVANCRRSRRSGAPGRR